MEARGKENRGRKVFFLHPHPVIGEELLASILESEYEVYLVKDHLRLLNLLREYPDSVLFLNIDAEVKGVKWADYARSIVSSPETKQVRLGVLSHGEDREAIQVYLDELAVPCGFIVLRAGIENSKRSLLSALKDVQAIGQRKSVRARCGAGSLASFNVKYGARYHPGSIRDISSAGFAGSFGSGLRLETETHLTDIQLRLRGRLIRVSAVVALKRESEEGTEVYVFLFDKEVTTETKLKLRLFIHELLQSEMEKRMEGSSNLNSPPPKPATLRPLEPDDIESPP